MIGVPEHWNLATIDEIASRAVGAIRIGPFGSALKKHEYADSGVRVLGIEDVFPNRLVSTRSKYIPATKYQELTQYTVERGDLLVTNMGTVGRTCVVPDGLETSIISSHLIKVSLNKKKAWPPYVSWALNACPTVLSQIRLRCQGAIMAGFNSTLLRQLQIPLPPLPEQRRITDILDKADALRAKRRAAVTMLTALTESIFREMFTSTLQGPAVDVAKQPRRGLPKQSSWELLRKVARLATGHTPDRDRPDYWNGDIPWISLTDIRDLDGTVATATIQNVTSIGIDNSSAVILPAGTVCFSRTASVGFVTVMGSPMSTSQDFVNWVCGPRLNPIYLMWALLTSRKRLQALSSGSTHKTIYVRVVEQFHALVPPIGLQNEFAERVSAIERLKRTSEASLSAFDSLFGSLQERAFSGAL